MVTDTEESNSDNEESVIPPLIYLEESDDKEYNICESPSDPPSAELPRNPDLQAKTLLRNRPRNPIMMPYQNLPLPQGGFLRGT